jgi:hypothetical protein
VAKMASRWQGWSHRADGDGGDRSRRPDITVLSLHGRGIVVRLPFEGSAILFRGCGASAVQEWVASATGLLLAMPHSVAQWRGWLRRGSWRSSAGA